MKNFIKIHTFCQYLYTFPETNAQIYNSLHTKLRIHHLFDTAQAIQQLNGSHERIYLTPIKNPLNTTNQCNETISSDEVANPLAVSFDCAQLPVNHFECRFIRACQQADTKLWRSRFKAVSCINQ